MNTNFLLSTKTTTFIRNYRHVIVLLWWIAGFSMAYGMKQSIGDNPEATAISPSLNPDVLFSAVSVLFGFGFTLMFAVLGLPAFFILRKMETLLARLRENPSFKLSEQKELSQLKKLFIVQLLINVGVFILAEIPRLKAYVNGQGPEALGANGKAALYITMRMDAYLSWLTAPFEKTMPLIYLIALIAIIRIGKITEKNQEELEHTV